MILETLREIYKACDGKLPTRYAANGGRPKSDAMVDAKPLIGDRAGKSAFMMDLRKLSAAGLIVYVPESKRVCLTPDAIELAAGPKARAKAEADLAKILEAEAKRRAAELENAQAGDGLTQVATDPPLAPAEGEQGGSQTPAPATTDSEQKQS